MSKKIESIKARQAQLAGSMQAITAAAENEGRTLTTDEQGTFDGYVAEYDSNKGEIGRLERLAEIEAEQSQPMNRVVQPMDAATTTAPPGTVPSYGSAARGTVAAHNFQNHGFTKGVGEYLVAVYRAGTDGHRDPRLMINAVSTFGGEGVGADGAYALPPQFVANITNAVMPAESFLNALRPIQTNSSTLVVPTNEKAPWSATGITSAKTAEGAAITQSKPGLNEVRVTLYKAASLVSVSEEALSDIPFLASWVMDQMGQHLRYQLEDWVINGTGTGEPLGVINAASTVAISDAASTASTFGAVDIQSMEAALAPGSGAFYLCNPTAFPALASMSTGTGGVMLMQPDMSVAPKQTLLGRPLYKAEVCPVLDTTGDVMLIQPSGFVFATKSNGVQTASTIGFAFDQDLQSFRATLRAGFAPLLSAKVARAKSASSYISNSVVITGGRS